jgi:hypothetical protein
LLKSLEKGDCQKPTIARFWNVKQVAAHILDGNIRALSIQRDQYNAEQPPAIDAYQQLVGWLNQLNADWIKAFNRVSPQVLIALLQATGPEVNHYFSSLPLNEKAIFPVAWAGEAESFNRLHIAREYTERWLHQQQIRDALERPGIMISKFFYPFIHTFMQGDLPKAYQEVIAETDTHITIEVTGGIGGVWHLLIPTKPGFRRPIGQILPYCWIWVKDDRKMETGRCAKKHTGCTNFHSSRYRMEIVFKRDQPCNSTP